MPLNLTESNPVEETHDFSLVLGGPLFQLLRRAHLEGDHLELLRSRLLVITLIAWLPLLLLTTFGSRTGSVDWLSFFRDVELHVRFLVALPILVSSELIVHSRIRPVVRRFIERRFDAGPILLSRRDAARPAADPDPRRRLRCL